MCQAHQVFQAIQEVDCLDSLVSVGSAEYQLQVRQVTLVGQACQGHQLLATAVLADNQATAVFQAVVSLVGQVTLVLESVAGQALAVYQDFQELEHQVLVASAGIAVFQEVVSVGIQASLVQASADGQVFQVNQALQSLEHQAIQASPVTLELEHPVSVEYQVTAVSKEHRLILKVQLLILLYYHQVEIILMMLTLWIQMVIFMYGMDQHGIM